MSKVKVSTLDNVFYYITCVTSFGGAYILKVIIRKALETKDCGCNGCKCDAKTKDV
jgi:hypothetical protein